MFRRSFTLAALALALTLATAASIFAGTRDSAPAQLRILKGVPPTLLLGQSSLTNITPIVYAEDTSGNQTNATVPKLGLVVVVPKAFKVYKAFYQGMGVNVRPKKTANRYSWQVRNYSGTHQFFIYITGMKATPKKACSVATVTIPGMSKTVLLCTKVVSG